MGVPNPFIEEWVDEAPHEEWPDVLVRMCPDRSRIRLAVDIGCLIGPALGKGKVIMDTISSAWTMVRAGLSDLAVKLNEIHEEVIIHVVFDGGVCPTKIIVHGDWFLRRNALCWSDVIQRFVMRRMGTLTSGASDDGDIAAATERGHQALFDAEAHAAALVLAGIADVVLTNDRDVVGLGARALFDVFSEKSTVTYFDPRIFEAPPPELGLRYPAMLATYAGVGSGDYFYINEELKQKIRDTQGDNEVDSWKELAYDCSREYAGRTRDDELLRNLGHIDLEILDDVLRDVVGVHLALLEPHDQEKLVLALRTSICHYGRPPVGWVEYNDFGEVVSVAIQPLHEVIHPDANVSERVDGQTTHFWVECMTLDVEDYGQRLGAYNLKPDQKRIIREMSYVPNVAARLKKVCESDFYTTNTRTGRSLPSVFDVKLIGEAFDLLGGDDNADEGEAGNTVGGVFLSEQVRQEWCGAVTRQVTAPSLPPAKSGKEVAEGGQAQEVRGQG
jgi:hypothetical protein